MVSHATQQKLGTAWMLLVVGLCTVLMLATGSGDGAGWGILGVAFGTACALLGIYAGQQSSNSASL